MNDRPQPETHALIRKFQRGAHLATRELVALESVPVRIKHFDEERDIVSSCSGSSDCFLLLSGFVVRYRLISSKKRQIYGIQLKGDMPDLQTLFLDKSDHNISNLGPVTIGLVAKSDLRWIIDTFPNIAHSIWRDTLIEAAISRAWMSRIGRRNAEQRVAHLLCEFIVRSRRAGAAKDNIVEMPLTQNVIADAIGLSSVQVNKSLMRLKCMGLIQLRYRKLEIFDFIGLCEIAIFDPIYLHIGIGGA